MFDLLSDRLEGRPMHMRHANIETINSAATYVATEVSCRQKPFGLLLSGDIQALARRCSR
jgi:hypothetical protein